MAVLLSHLTTHVRRDPRFESMLVRIALREWPVPFNISTSSMHHLDNEIISEPATYGVLVSDADGNCRIQNPIYEYRTIK